MRSAFANQTDSVCDGPVKEDDRRFCALNSECSAQRLRKHLPKTSNCKERITPRMSPVPDIMGENSNGNVTSRRRGKCKWFNVAKGWGFITPVDGGADVFVHQSVIQMAGFRSLGDDEEVEFECKTSDKGLEATMVTGLEGEECKGSHRRPMSKKKFKKVRCYNCGEFANHIAAKCNLGPQPKKCHHCKAVDHLIAACPLREEKKTKTKPAVNGDCGKEANGTSDAGSEEDSMLNATETASSSSSSEKHRESLSDSGITRRSVD